MLLRRSDIKSYFIVISIVTVFMAFAGMASADPRPFTFNTDTYPVGKGNAEYEQWVTWHHSTDEDDDYQRFDFRHELEYGVADNFDLAVYFASWRYEDSEAFTGTRFNSSSIEGVLYLSNPVTDPIGAGLYAEFGVGEHELEFEQKLLLQKNIGDWVLAYNLVLETEIEHVGEEGEENEVEGVIAHTAGVSYALGRDVRVGAELVVESEFENWNEHEATTVYAGPNVHWQATDNLWLTLTPTIQLSDEKEAADYIVRLIVGYQF